MKKFRINTISDIQGFKKVFTDLETNESKLYFFEIYEFKREIKQCKNIPIEYINATNFHHAIDKYLLEKQIKECIQSKKRIFKRLEELENKILKKIGNKLRGKKDRSKINSFLRS